jgi:SAM-dependent methyltransferase
MREDTPGQALSIRLWLACLATQELLCIYLGIRLGMYDVLTQYGAATSEQVAERVGVAPRYAREWLEQQAVAGLVHVDHPERPQGAPVFSLPEASRRVLTESSDLLSRVAGILPVGAVAHALPRLLEVYRTGEGLSDSDYGPDWHDGHSGANRALYVHLLSGWIRQSLPDVHARCADGDARIADVACGAGWAAIALAQSYPRLRVDGFELNARLVDDARSHAARANVAERVSFAQHDCTGPPSGQYDLVCLFDTLHEVPRPVEMLRACGTMCGPDGSVLLMDAKVRDTFSAPGDEIERFQYTTSVLHCLPVCLGESPSAGTGTVMRQSMVSEYARAAGFGRIDVLPIADRFHRFYRLWA